MLKDHEDNCPVVELRYLKRENSQLKEEISQMTIQSNRGIHRFSMEDQRPKNLAVRFVNFNFQNFQNKSVIS